MVATLFVCSLLCGARASLVMRPTKEQKADSIKVYLRVRPPIGRELAEAHQCKNLKFDPNDNRVIRVRDARQGSDATVEKKFMFHRVFPPEATQQDVYDAFARDAVEDALQGYHGVMFVYGQTGSGKTFTISNEEPGKEGMLQRSLKAIWDCINLDKDFEYVCSVSYVQLYNEMLTDMLETNPETNSVRLSGVADRRNDVIMVNDATNKPIAREVRNYQETIGMFKAGVARRVQASTEMNSVSSRSHTVFTLYLKKQARTERLGGASDGVPTALEGRLVICDLAGSERVKKTDVRGVQLAEATHINGSLLVLGRVVAALTDPKGSQHVPYRESKLTRILQYSLSGWGKTRIVVNVSPSDDNTDETLGAIAFGQRAIQIKQTAEKHETLDYKALYLELQRQIDNNDARLMRDVVAAANAEVEARLTDYTERIKVLESEVDMLRHEISQKDALIAHLKGGGPLPSTPLRVADTSSSNAVPSPGDLLMPADGGDKWQEIVMLLKKRMTHQDQRLVELSRDVHRYQEQLSVKEHSLLAVASRLRTHMAMASKERLYFERTIAELNEKLASLQGVEYLNANNGQTDDDERQMQQQQSSPASRSPTLDEESLGGAAYDADDRLWKAIHLLQNKLNESYAYNRTARKAIRMLASDLEAARKDS